MTGYDLIAKSADVNEHDIRKAKPVLLGNFFDILIRNGRWLAKGKQEIPKVPFPCFKVEIAGKSYVESWNGQQIREATSDECAILQFRPNHSAIVLENALKAYFGLTLWEPRFESLKVEAVEKVSKMFLPS